MKIKTAENGVVYLYSPIIPVRHGFSTRVGGVSTDRYTKSLNLAFGRGDEREIVLENLRLFAEAVKFDEKSVISVGQIHSAEVMTAGKKDAGLGYFREANFSLDGYITTERGVTLGVKTADCVPVLFYAPLPEGREAVSAVHSGWRGTASGISVVAAKKLISLGAKPEEIRAAIGPAIGECCFETGQDAVAVFEANYGKEFRLKFISDGKERGIDGKYFPNLRAMIKSQLLSLGFAAENIDISDLCTSCRQDLFYSHRASGGKRGTMLSVINLERRSND